MQDAGSPAGTRPSRTYSCTSLVSKHQTRPVSSLHVCADAQAKAAALQGRAAKEQAGADIAAEVRFSKCMCGFYRPSTLRKSLLDAGGCGVRSGCSRRGPLTQTPLPSCGG